MRLKTKGTRGTFEAGVNLPTTEDSIYSDHSLAGKLPRFDTPYRRISCAKDDGLETE